LNRSHRKHRVLAFGPVAGLVVLVALASATPDAATWRRQTLLGQNADYYFRYVSISEHPASYYQYSRSLRLEKIRKADRRIVETIRLSGTAYSQDMETNRWTDAPDTVPSFDLATYLRANRIATPFANDLIQVRTFTIDSGGVWEVFEDGRIQLATRAELERQIPGLGEGPRVVGIEETGRIRGEDFFLRIQSGDSASDSDWAEDLLMIRGVELRFLERVPAASVPLAPPSTR
jgi:hypothetical protein